MCHPYLFGYLFVFCLHIYLQCIKIHPFIHFPGIIHSLFSISISLLTHFQPIHPSINSSIHHPFFYHPFSPFIHSSFFIHSSILDSFVHLQNNFPLILHPSTIITLKSASLQNDGWRELTINKRIQMNHIK